MGIRGTSPDFQNDGRGSFLFAFLNAQHAIYGKVA